MNTLKAEKREAVGRKVSKLRSQGILPANVFGKKVTSLAVSVDTKDFMKVYKEAGETGLVELVVGGQKKPVLIHNVQVHPVDESPLHVDFLQVDLKEKVTASVQVEISGESPVEKQGLGTVVQHLNEIEVEALPTDLPEKFEVDASKLTEVEQAVQVKDLSYDKSKVEIKTDPEGIVVKVEPPKKVEEEVVAPPAADVTSGEAVEGEQPVDQGEKPVSSEEKSTKEDK